MLGLLLRGMRPLVLLFCLACSAGAFSPLSFSPKQLFVSRLSGMRKTNTPLRFQQKALRAPLQSRGVQCSATSDETLQHVPVVDFHGFVTGNAQEKEKVALQIFRAFNDIGFVTLVNHGLEPEVLKQTFRSSRSVCLPRAKIFRSFLTRCMVLSGTFLSFRTMRSKSTSIVGQSPIEGI